MLVSFKVNNFLSFNKEQTFSMIPSLENENQDHLIILKNVKILKMGIVLGANSSGKSNLLKAIAVGTAIINGESILRYRNLFCKLNKQNRDQETLFEFSFYVNKDFYTYGFTINLNSGKILTEYLYTHDLEVDQEKVIFERISEANNLENMFTYRVNISPSLRKKLNNYLTEFDNNSNQLFLTKINQENIFSKQIKEFSDVLRYFKTKININFHDQDFQLLSLSLFEKQNEINHFLNIFDTGIAGLIFEEVKLNYFLENHLEFYELLKGILINNQEKSFSFRIKQSMFSIVFKDDNYIIYKILLKHQNAEIAFEFYEESDGVRRLFDLFDIILAPNRDSIYVFDELSRSIHPLLISKFIDLFLEKLGKFPVQLLFTTHEVNILKSNSIRKDEIWFIEKAKDSSSKLYSLDIFKLTNKQIFDSYLDGNYGAIPIFIKDDE